MLKEKLRLNSGKVNLYGYNGWETNYLFNSNSEPILLSSFMLTLNDEELTLFIKINKDLPYIIRGIEPSATILENRIKFLASKITK